MTDQKRRERLKTMIEDALAEHAAGETIDISPLVKNHPDCVAVLCGRHPCTIGPCHVAPTTLSTWSAPPSEPHDEDPFRYHDEFERLERAVIEAACAWSKMSGYGMDYWGRQTESILDLDATCKALLAFEEAQKP